MIGILDEVQRCAKMERILKETLDAVIANITDTNEATTSFKLVR